MSKDGCALDAPVALIQHGLNAFQSEVSVRVSKEIGSILVQGDPVLYHGIRMRVVMVVPGAIKYTLVLRFDGDSDG